MADDKKVLSLNNVKIVKNYIQQSIEDASSMLNSEYNKKLSEINSEIEIIKSNNTLEGLEELRLELDALNANFEDKKEALEILKTDFENLSNGITDGTVFSEGQLNEIIKTALIDETVITDEMVSTPNVFTQKIVALIGNFGKINAGQVEAGTLKGSTIESTNKINGTNDPVWTINNSGSGYLANKNISWDKNGNVTFGNNVKLKWGNVEGGDTAISSAVSNVSQSISNRLNEVESKLENYQSGSGSTNVESVTAMLNAWSDDKKLNPTELNALLDDCNKIDKEYLSLKSDIDSLNTDLENWAKNVETGKTPSDLGTSNKTSAEVIRSFKIDITELTDKRNAVINIKYYYTSLSLDPNNYNCIEISNTYPLSGISDYYKTQNEYILKYQRSSTEYLSGARFGSKATYIGSTGIYSGTISGDNIVGEKISGLTVQSGTDGTLNGGGTGPCWKLNNDGSGYLAKKNINWTADGTVTFGNNVKLKWGNNIDGAPDMTKYATKEDLNSIEGGGITQTMFTELGDTWIKTTEVEAQNLKIRKIETKSEAKDSIEIKDNYIHCLNDNGNKNLVISSNDIDTDMVDALANSNVFSEEDLWGFSNLKNAIISPMGQRALEVLNEPDSILPLLEFDKKGNREFTKLYDIPVTPKFEYTTYTKSNYISDEHINLDIINNYNIPGNESMLLDTATFGDIIAASVDKTANSIGYLFKDSTIRIYPKLSTISNFREAYSSGNNRFLSLGTSYPSYWNFLGDYICTLYKKNSDGTWKPTNFTRLPQAEKSIINVKSGEITFKNRNWSNIIGTILQNGTPVTQQSLHNLYYNGVIEFNITESGEYGIAITLTNAEYYYSDGISETKNVLPYFFVSNDVFNLVPLSDDGGSSDPANVPSLLGVGDGFDEGPVNITRPSLQPDDNIGGSGSGSSGSSGSGSGSSGSDTTFEPTILPGGIDGLNASYDLEIINNTIPDGYTEIGKNGLVTYNGQNLLACYDKGIEMKTRIKSGQNILTNNFYGFKVTPDGLYYCNGGTEYKKWTPS